jgi:FtsZ-interacting cell division protein YlmF
VAEKEAFARYGISDEDVIRAREREDLVQFLGRTCWRIPDDEREIDYRVYDYAQALFLRDFIQKSGRPFSVVLEYVEEAKVDEHKPKPVGRPKTLLTEVQKQERADRRRKSNAASKRKSRARLKEQEAEQEIVHTLSMSNSSTAIVTLNPAE